MLGWGIAVVIHGANVFFTGQFLGKEWEERKVKELLDAEKQSKK